MYIHLVFSTKDRIPYLADRDFRLQVHRNLEATAHHLGCPALNVGGVEDHVHLLVRLGRTSMVANVVKEVKRVSSLSVKQLSPQLRDFNWQGGYGGFSVSGSMLETVGKYIQTQEQHHKTETFKEEFLRLLAEHDLEWDERYMWE